MTVIIIIHVCFHGYIVVIVVMDISDLLLWLQVISSVTGNQECVNDIAASEVLVYLLLVIQSVPQCKSVTCHHHIWNQCLESSDIGLPQIWASSD